MKKYRNMKKQIYVATMYAKNEKNNCMSNNERNIIIGYYSKKELAIMSIYNTIEKEHKEYQLNYELKYELKTDLWGNQIIVSYTSKDTKEKIETRVYEVNTITLNEQLHCTNTFW